MKTAEEVYRIKLIKHGVITEQADTSYTQTNEHDAVIDAMQEYADQSTKELQERIKKLEELNEARKELAEFYGERLCANAVFLAVHHAKESEATIDKGVKLRAKIDQLEKEIEQ